MLHKNRTTEPWRQLSAALSRNSNRWRADISSALLTQPRESRLATPLCQRSPWRNHTFNPCRRTNFCWWRSICCTRRLSSRHERRPRRCATDRGGELGLDVHAWWSGARQFQFFRGSHHFGSTGHDQFAGLIQYFAIQRHDTAPVLFLGYLQLHGDGVTNFDGQAKAQGLSQIDGAASRSAWNSWQFALSLSRRRYNCESVTWFGPPVENPVKLNPRRALA